MTPQRQRLVLVVLLLVMAWVLWRQVGPRLGGAGGRPSSAADAAGSGEAGAGRAESVTVIDLRLADLEASPGNYSPGRDPFRFAPKPPPPRPAAQPAPAPVRPAPPPPPPEQANARPAAPRPPAFNLDYLGSFGSKQRRIAVFSDGDDIYNALVGDVLQEKFIIDQIGHESVDVKFVGFPEEPAKRLPAGG